MTALLRKQAAVILEQAIGNNAVFRDGQWEAIESLVVHRERLLVVQQTGWGKSLVYFVSTRLLRETGSGLTILISPLLALMRNQLEAAARFGLKAARIDSSNYNEHDDILGRLRRNQVDILFISPERLKNEKFRQDIWTVIYENVGLLVIDEVHCISDWGHDFRPDYRRILSVIDDLPPDTPVVGTTATANTRVIEDVCEVLGGDVRVSRGPLTRNSLRLYVYPEIQTAAQRIVLLCHLLRNLPGSGIIYCTTTRDCLIVSDWLKHEGFNVEPYFSNVEQFQANTREALEDKLKYNQLKALVASVALGMGYDKPDLGFVIHYQMPGSIISYYQQIGRAGRGIDNAHVILMRGDEDREIQEYFIDSAFPTENEVRLVLNYVKLHQQTTTYELEREINVGRGALYKVLSQLAIENSITFIGNTVTLGSGQMPDLARWERVRQQRMTELAQMEAYCASSQCLMQFLANILEDPTHPDACGRCKNCTSVQSRYKPDPEQIQRATRFLYGREPIWIEPRQQWPGRNLVTKQAKIKGVNERGLALSLYNDGGYGTLVKEGKYLDQRFSDRLVSASAKLIYEKWNGQIAWVTFVPSVRHPSLVSDFARRLAKEMNLPFAAVVHSVGERPEQKTMQNSVHQLQNVADAFKVNGPVRREPVLLVDDIVDSGWTLTLIGWLLRENGVPSVFPFALSLAAKGKTGIE
jgi:ATP-dependent DNA helicase RecQ